MPRKERIDREYVAEVVERVVRRVVREELARKFHGSTSACGVLRNGQELMEYLNMNNIQTVKKWYNNYGLPLSKSPRGTWTCTKSLLDRWFLNRHIMMKKAQELKMKGKGLRATFGKPSAVRAPEQYTEEERARVIASINEDKAITALFRS